MPCAERAPGLSQWDRGGRLELGYVPRVTPNEPREPFTALDWIAVVLAVLGAGSMLWLAAIGPTFAAMYRDFGSATELPMLTRFTTSLWGPALLALPVLGVLGAGLRAHAISARRLGVVLAFVLALGGIALCYVGDYLPIWQVADAIRAE